MGWVRINPRYELALRGQNLTRARLSAPAGRHPVRPSEPACSQGRAFDYRRHFSQERTPCTVARSPRQRLGWLRFRRQGDAGSEDLANDCSGGSALPGSSGPRGGQRPGVPPAARATRDDRCGPLRGATSARTPGHRPRLGKELARMHAAGIEHGDLYAKHVLAGAGPRFCFLDWQPARMHRTTRTWCYRDLAALDATVPASLVTDRTRLVFLRSYWEALDIFNRRELARQNTTGLFRLAGDIRRHSVKLQQKRPHSQIAARAAVSQCAEHRVAGRRSPVRHPALSRGTRQKRTSVAALCEQRRAPGDYQRPACRRSYRDARPAQRPRLWLAAVVASPAPSPEVEQAALLFRLEQLRVAAPRLLAFGEVLAGTWQRQSFLLTELSKTNVTLGEFLTTAAGRGRCAYSGRPASC